MTKTVYLASKRLFEEEKTKFPAKKIKFLHSNLCLSRIKETF